MMAGELVTLIMHEAKRYAPQAQASLRRNDHLCQLSGGSVPTQEQIDAVLVDFVNAIAGRRGVDLALAADDLRHGTVAIAWTRGEDCLVCKGPCQGH